MHSWKSHFICIQFPLTLSRKLDTGISQCRCLKTINQSIGYLGLTFKFVVRSQTIGFNISIEHRTQHFWSISTGEKATKPSSVETIRPYRNGLAQKITPTSTSRYLIPSPLILEHNAMLNPPFWLDVPKNVSVFTLQTSL